MSPEVNITPQTGTRKQEIIKGLKLVAVGLLYGAYFVRFGIVNKNVYADIVGVAGAGSGLTLATKHFIEAHKLKPKKPTV